jgi:hypothetical protein
MTQDNPSRDKEAQEPNSIIRYLLDQFAISHIIKTVGDKTSWKITSELNNAIVLFIFLLFTFYVSKILSWDLLSAPILILIIILGFIITEFIGANTSFFKSLFFSEEKANYFLKHFESYKTINIEKDLYTLNFSPKNIQTLLDLIQSSDNKIPLYVVDEILKYNSLSPENIDTLFSKTINVYELRRDLIIDLLIKYQSQLSPHNLDNLYKKYKNDPSLVKLIFITQIDSLHLVNQDPLNTELLHYYDQFQKDAEIRNKKNKLINRTQIKSSFYRGLVLITVWPFLIILFIGIGIGCFQIPLSYGVLLFEVSCTVSLGIIAILFKYALNPYIDALKDKARQALLNL